MIRGAMKLVVVSGLLVLAIFAGQKIYSDHGLAPAISFALLLACLWLIFGMLVAPRTGAVIVNVLGGYRSVGPGIQILFRLFEWVDQMVGLEKFDIPFLANPDTARRDVVPMRVVIGCETHIDYLFEYTRFNDKKDQRETAIRERVEALLTVYIRQYFSRDAVYKDLPKISKGLLEKLRSERVEGVSLEEYYGIKVNYITIPEITLPEKLRDAELLPEIEQEKGRALSVSVRNLKREAKKLMKEDKSLTFKQAVGIVGARDGTVPTEVKVYDIGPNLDKRLPKRVF